MRGKAAAEGYPPLPRGFRTIIGFPFPCPFSSAMRLLALLFQDGGKKTVNSRIVQIPRAPSLRQRLMFPLVTPFFVWLLAPSEKCGRAPRNAVGFVKRSAVLFAAKDVKCLLPLDTMRSGKSFSVSKTTVSQCLHLLRLTLELWTLQRERLQCSRLVIVTPGQAHDCETSVFPGPLALLLPNTPLVVFVSPRGNMARHT